MDINTHHKISILTDTSYIVCVKPKVTLHKNLKVEKWKELCLYHERDFNLMFTDKEATELLEYHKDKVVQF
jgi:hypothetical protein